MNILLVLAVLPISSILGHGIQSAFYELYLDEYYCEGNMIRPKTWFNPDGTDGNHVGCGVLDLPHTEFEDVQGEKPDCMNFW